MADRIVVLHDGIVEQIGSPLELYDRPANTFVAGFIGSPSMNLVPGTIRGDGFLADGGARLPLQAAPAGADGRRAIYGIRPEHFQRGGGLEAEVSVVEPTGSETQVFVRFGTDKLVAAFRDRISARPGERLALSPDPALVHLFDEATGKRIA